MASTSAASPPVVELVPKGNPGPDPTERDHPELLRNVREHLRRNVIQNNPFVQHDILEFRANAISKHRPAVTNLTRNQVQAYRIVGLTQRHERRKWLNLHDIIQECHTKWFEASDKIVCVELNLEDEQVNPVRQVVMHAACDMIIGIHGAQLTEAIWMKHGSVVIELLPWIHEGARYGDWTRTTFRPTPLGAIFSEGSLHHIGYPLERDSVPYCLDKSDDVERNKCLDRFSWENRNFQVDPSVVRDMITKFVPTAKDDNNAVSFTPLATCEEWQRKAGNKVYVLYNIYCSAAGTNDTDRTGPSAHHFYWPKPRNRPKRNNPPSSQ